MMIIFIFCCYSNMSDDTVFSNDNNCDDTVVSSVNHNNKDSINISNDSKATMSKRISITSITTIMLFIIIPTLLSIA